MAMMITCLPADDLMLSASPRFGAFALKPPKESDLLTR